MNSIDTNARTFQDGYDDEPIKEKPNFAFDDGRSEKQRQFFYDGLSNEPSIGEKMKAILEKNSRPK